MEIRKRFSMEMRKIPNNMNKSDFWSLTSFDSAKPSACTKIIEISFVNWLSSDIHMTNRPLSVINSKLRVKAQKVVCCK